MTGRSPNRPPPPEPRALLVLGPEAPETDDLLVDLRNRLDLRLLLAATLEAAEAGLRTAPVALAIVRPEAPTEWVDTLLGFIGRLRPGIPLLAIRLPHAEEPAAWRASSVGVLRTPLVPQALSRSVDVVLQLKPS